MFEGSKPHEEVGGMFTGKGILENWDVYGVVDVSVEF